MDCFVHRSLLPASAEEAWAWHVRPGALERLNPPWNPAQVLERTGGVTDGGRVRFRVRIGPFCKEWIAEHREHQPGRFFSDVQVSGPFARWEHYHHFESAGSEQCRLEDRIEYALPFGVLGRWLAGGGVRKTLRRVFAYRHRVLCDDLQSHRLGREKGVMKVLVSGSTGMIGSALTPFLSTGGHAAVPLRRAPPSEGEGGVTWDPAAGIIDAEKLEGFDAVVHLAGESIAAGRWNEERKQRIRDSRVKGTRLLSETLAQRNLKPKVLVCASAIGYYGDRGDELLREDSPAGTGFLPEVCKEWEAACDPARQAGIRVVNLRLGVVLSPRGGALAQMLTPFKMGVGGKLGSGRQFMSWLALDDAIGVIHHALINESVHGPVNAVSPQPVTNREFTRTLGRVLRRPTIFPMPAFAARLLFGEMADALLLAGARADPARLRETGYRFRFPDLGSALRHVLGRPDA